MGISIKSRKILWSKAAGLCSMCKKELALDATLTDDETLIGEECHIVAQSKDGPRGDSSLSEEARDKYSNLILLCRNHHKEIDSQPGEYSIDKLHDIKSAHEDWVKSNLQADESIQNDDLIYSDYIDKWEKLAHIYEWENWTSYMLSGDQPKIWKRVEKDLYKLPPWILARVWPRRYPHLELAFENFRLILSDLLNTFYTHSMDPHPDSNLIITEKFYQINEWNPERYKELGDKYTFHVKLVEDLTLELTRAANYVCDQIRKNILHNYRLDDGVLLVMSGPYMDLSYRTFKTEYTRDQLSELPYKGIDDFKTNRNQRDVWFGVGTDENDPEWKKLGYD